MQLDFNSSIEMLPDSYYCYWSLWCFRCYGWFILFEKFKHFKCSVYYL